MTLRVVLIDPQFGHVEEPGLPPLVAGRDFFYYFPPRPGGERKKPLLPEQVKRPVCKEELLRSKFVSEHLWPQMDSPRQEPPIVRG